MTVERREDSRERAVSEWMEKEWMQKTKVINGGTLKKNDYDSASNYNISNVSMSPILILMHSLHYQSF